MSRSWVWLILISFFTLSGCGKESESIPNVFVQYSVTVQEFNIKAVNRVLLVPNHGIKGLMIVASGSGYVAFDRCSSVNPQNGCAVEPDDNGITATDPCTGAKYLLTDGTPQKAPAVRSLKIYTTSFRGGQVINVSN
jgi:nitrite reductase/ring-hydroxylating ferredoxin subunit